MKYCLHANVVPLKKQNNSDEMHTKEFNVKLTILNKLFWVSFLKRTVNKYDNFSQFAEFTKYKSIKNLWAWKLAISLCAYGVNCQDHKFFYRNLNVRVLFLRLLFRNFYVILSNFVYCLMMLMICFTDKLQM